MDKKELLNRISVFDPEIYSFLQDDLAKQRYTLSLIPTENAISPYAAHMEGSVLANRFMDHHEIRNVGRLETITADRAAELFHADHAIVRLSNITAASRAVFFALVKNGDNVLSFNGRKKNHCTGENMAYNFTSYGVDPSGEFLSLDTLREAVAASKPKLVIYSPVAYPRNTDYTAMAEIAHGAGAYLWVDLGQNAGLVAAGLLPSPVGHADVVTLPSSDSLHGPQRIITLTTAALAKQMDETVINTGHASLRQNSLAALAIALKEAGGETYKKYARQALDNAQALAAALKKDYVRLITGGTDTHLVVPELPDRLSNNEANDLLTQAGFAVKVETMPTNDPAETRRCLRLSTLLPTTRGLKEKEMMQVGHLIARVLTQKVTDDDLTEVRREVANMLLERPVFSDEWLAPNPDEEALSKERKKARTGFLRGLFGG